MNQNYNILNTDLVVIGGGAAGLMSAYTASQRGLKVLILDPNKTLGRKVRITGKGRCNVCNNCDIKEFMNNIPGDGRFLYSAVNRFKPEDTISFFEDRGVPLKTERGNRVFPVSDNANDIADLMTRLIRKNNVFVIKKKALQIEAQDGRIVAVYTDSDKINCRAAAICTGGMSYPLTGSNGDGYKFAKQFGHSVISPRPSLIPLESNDDYCREMQGFTLKNVVLNAFENNKLIFSELGEMLFTHFGVSGPLVLSASSHMRNMGKAEYRLEIDMKPGLDDEKLDKRILRDFEKNANKAYQNSLGELLGKSMIPVVVSLSGIPADQKVNSITKEQRAALLHLLKHFPVSVSGTRPIDEAIITSGGINTKEINPRTMESKLIDGLFFAGEVIDADGYTGGFNLQIAWSTGYVLGNSVLKDEFYE